MITPRPATIATLRAFAIWWLRNKPFLVPPAGQSLHQVGQYLGVTLYRDAPFQVQLFIGAAHAAVVPHAHPSFESLEYWVAGNGEDRGSYWTEGGKHVAGMPYVAPREWHSAQAGPSGICFLSIQRWADGVPIISGHLDWMGGTMDPLQASQITQEIS